MKIKNFALAISAVIALFTGLASTGFATTYRVPADGALVGSAGYTVTTGGETLISIAKKYDLGVNSIRDSNPMIPTTAVLPAGVHVNLPTTYILPPLAHKGIVVNLPEMRMYYYSNNGLVKTYPIGIGLIGRTIPLTRTTVIRKVRNPIWIPTENIRAFNEQQGIVLPKTMPSGPDNPLGPYAIYLSIPTYLIHSTIYPDSIGRRASFGCLRMHESDIKDFFPIITPGTTVLIIDMPTKVGWQGRTLLLETHAPLEEHKSEYNASYQSMVNSVDGAIVGKPTFVDWQLVADLSQTRDGVPHDIGFRM